MPEAQSPWWMRSTLIAVRDLARSSAFYQDVTGLPELLREDQVAVLGEGTPGSFALLLRQANRGAIRHGQQALGVRALCLQVGTTAELDRVEERLGSYGLMQERRTLIERDGSEIVRGHDPDGQPLIFAAVRSDLAYSTDDYRLIARLMYAVDM